MPASAHSPSQRQRPPTSPANANVCHEAPLPPPPVIRTVAQSPIPHPPVVGTFAPARRTAEQL
eukprot:2366236-Amphidinium_carterae.1